MTDSSKPGEMPPYLKAAAAAFQGGDLEGCFRILRDAQAADPGNAKILNNLGVFSASAGRIDDAIGYFRRVVGIDADSYEAWYNLGLLLRQNGHNGEAREALAQAVRCRPQSAAALTALGLAEISLKAREAALAHLQRAAELEPDVAERWSNLGNLLRELRAYDEARAALERALKLSPNSLQVRYNIATLDYKVGDFEKASAEFDAIVRDNVDEDVFTSLERRYFPHISEIDATGEQLLALGREISDKMDRTDAPFYTPTPRGPRLRIGLLSTDFRRHSCAYFLQPLFENRDRSRFEFHCYADFTQAEPDKVTDWFRASADHWTDTTALSPPEIARKVADDRIDVLLELGGYTGGSMIAVCAYRPAPAIVEWLGFPASTGLPEIAYRIGDAVADPAGKIEAHFCEKLVRLDGPFLCFSPPPEAPDVAPPPILASGGPTFGTFNSAHKIRAHTARAWTRIVMAVPNATLLIKASLSTEPKTRERLSRMFAAAGLPEDRLVLIDGTQSTEAHLAAYARLDVALDTFPYNGTTTTCEALWMGVPVVAYAGDRHSARVGATLLAHAGLPELVATDVESYVALAVALGQDRARLAAYRGTIRRKLAASPVMDGYRWTRGFEAALERIYADATGQPVSPAPTAETVSDLLARADDAFKRGDIEQGFSALAAARAAAPSDVAILNRLGHFAAATDRRDAAIGYFRDATTLDPANYDAWFNLGMLLRDPASFDAAREALEKAIELRPDSAMAATALASVMLAMGDRTTARTLLERALALEPELPERWSNLGHFHKESGDHPAALAALTKALELAPNHLQARYNMALLQFEVGDFEAAIKSFETVDSTDKSNEATLALQRRYFLSIADAAKDGAALRSIGAAISARLQRPSAPLFAARKRGAKLRIGFLSPDFRRHSCAYFLKPLFENCDRGHYELHCFADFGIAPRDEISDWFAASATSWLETTRLAPAQIAQAVADANIDVLVELGGYTSGSLIAAAAYKPAPAIVEWLGFPGSTGIPEIGYRIGDATADPPSDAAAHFSEKLERLAGPFVCYSAPDDAPDVAPPPIAIVGSPTFGSFNGTQKIRPPVAEAWARIVGAIPNAKLLLKPPLARESKSGPRLRRMFLDAGLPSDRLILIDERAATAAHLAAYARIDVALDTFPYNGTTTTCEALWMGVPVVTCVGDRHSARVGASLLRHAGLGELVGETIDDYVQIATALGKDRARLAEYRRTLRARFASSPVMDGAGWTRNFEAAIEKIYNSERLGLLSRG